MTETIRTLQREHTIYWALLGVLGLCAVCYIYFVTSTIRTAVAIEDMETQMSELTLSLGQKEFNVISLKNNVSLSYAESRGFVPVASQIYITKKSVGFLPQSHNEI
jgi:hypothetical protein